MVAKGRRLDGAVVRTLFYLRCARLLRPLQDEVPDSNSHDPPSNRELVLVLPHLAHSVSVWHLLRVVSPMG